MIHKSYQLTFTDSLEITFGIYHWFTVYPWQPFSFPKRIVPSILSQTRRTCKINFVCGSANMLRRIQFFFFTFYHSVSKFLFFYFNFIPSVIPSVHDYLPVFDQLLSFFGKIIPDFLTALTWDCEKKVYWYAAGVVPPEKRSTYFAQSVGCNENVKWNCFKAYMFYCTLLHPKYIPALLFSSML